MSYLAKQIIAQLKKEIQEWEPEIKAEKFGTVLEIKDGIVKIEGLPDCLVFEKLKFPNDIYGIALNLNENSVGAVIIGEYASLKEGDIVKSTGEVIKIPVSKSIIGRVINSLGEPIDGRGRLNGESVNYPIEKLAPSVITRESVNTPLHTGIKAIDSMIPIGRGQRELIIGDRQTGKTALVIDTIINQSKHKGHDRPVICVYVAIGQKESKVARLFSILSEYGALDYTVLVNASSSSLAAMQYLAPYSGTAIGEYFMEQGMDVLLVYDDLTKHANAYREISLLLRRPAGREAYPGDIFYLHAKLLERAAKLNTEHGGGSLTALPIIETQAGDISSYIPTNVISITDGQIYLDTDLFNSGLKPAINVGLSVSRVGSAAQISAMKKVASRLRLELAQYRELAGFAQFSSDLDKATIDKLERGKRLTEILKQEQYNPVQVALQVIIIYACINGFLDDVAVDKIKIFEDELYLYLESQHSDLINLLAEKSNLNIDIENKLKIVLTEFKKYKF